jgi:tryptophan synthase beta chain
MVGYFQSIIGKEAKQQILEQEGRLPDYLFACIGGGSNAIGLFGEFLDDTEVKIHAAEADGLGLQQGKTSATLSYGKPLVFQGTYSYCLVNERNEPVDAYSIAAGLNYPGISPQHAYLKDSGRAQYFPVSDDDAVEAFRLLCRLEGIIPAIESSHAIALAVKMMKGMEDKVSIINLSGRGDKDVDRIE